MSDKLTMRVFLATPGDLRAERAAVHRVINEHNLRRRSESNVRFQVVGWEATNGTARRPQEEINDLLGTSHFLLTLFKKKWGTEPGSPWGFTSGTEEELFTGLLELGRADQPMRDVWVGFLNHDSPDHLVTELRSQLVSHHAMMFEDLADIQSLKAAVKERLEGWESMATEKHTRYIEIVSSTGSEILKAAKLSNEGQKLLDLGQPLLAAPKLHEAAVLGGPEEKLAHSQYLRRQGATKEALQVTQDAIDQCLNGVSELYSTLTAEAFAAQSRVLRQTGDDLGAIGRLSHVLTLLTTDDVYARKARERIFDDRGLAHQATRAYKNAKSDFDSSLSSREMRDDSAQVAQSLVNLARLAVAQRDLPTATSHSSRAREILGGLTPTSLYANCLVLSSQLALRHGSAGDGIESAEQAVSLNRQFGNKRGEAIALLVLAQCERAIGAIEPAREHANASLVLNEEMGDSKGQEKARWLLNELTEV